jgi:ParB family chromosome partitioning protein
VAERVVARGLSVRETEKLVQRTLAGEEGTAVKSRPELEVVSEVLRTRSVQVQLRQAASGKGKLIVEFGDTASRDALVAAIKAAVEK